MHRPKPELVVLMLDVAIIVIALATLIGQLSAARQLYDWGGSESGMAVNTALCLVIFALNQAVLSWIILHRRNRL